MTIRSVESVSPARARQLVQWLEGYPQDEICLHVHPWCNFVTRAGVTIVGLTNVPSLMAADASRLYARNVTTLLEHLAPGGTLALDFDDEITAGACVTGAPEEGAT